jgi:flagellar motor switch protein FliN/FliY
MSTSSENVADPGLPTSGKVAAGQASAPEVVARTADFAELRPQTGPPGASSLQNLLDVHVTVSAELGRATLNIGHVLKLGVGSVLELNRLVSEPVDLIVQGVRLARGEVVVVDDRFAVRIKEIIDPKRRT